MFSRWKWLAIIKQPPTTHITNKICQIFMPFSQWMSGGLIRCWFHKHLSLSFLHLARIIIENRQRWIIPLQSGHMPIGHHYCITATRVAFSYDITQRSQGSWIRVPANITHAGGKSRGSEPRSPEPRGMKLIFVPLPAMSKKPLVATLFGCSILEQRCHWGISWPK